MELTRHNIDDQSSGAIRITPLESAPEASAHAEAPKRFRRLQADELVSRGDFVTDDHQAFAPWDGPTGFRADAFVKTVYRREESGAPATSELK